MIGKLLKIYRKSFVASWFAFSTGSAFSISLIRPFNRANSVFWTRLVGPICLKIMGVKLIIKNKEYLKNTSQAVVIGNHQNNLDLFVYGSLLDKKHAIIGKKSIRWIPVFGQLFWLSNHILLDRKNKDKAHGQMDKVEQVIKEKGISPFIFPEGTRGRGRGILPFKKGAFRMAINTKLPIIPIVASDYHKKINLKNWKAGKIIVEILEPISVENFTLNDLDELVKKTQSLVQEKFEELNRLAMQPTSV